MQEVLGEPYGLMFHHNVCEGSFLVREVEGFDTHASTSSRKATEYVIEIMPIVDLVTAQTLFENEMEKLTFIQSRGDFVWVEPLRQKLIAVWKKLSQEAK